MTALIIRFVFPEYIHDDFGQLLDFRKPCRVLYNTVESKKILANANDAAPEQMDDGKIRLMAVGARKGIQGLYIRLLSIVKRLWDEKSSVHLCVLGIEPLQREM